MPKVDGSNNTPNNDITLYDYFSKKQEKLSALNSIFTDSAGDNNLIEASDFRDYKQGKNSFIDNLIASGKTWSEDIISKVIDSIEILNKKESARIANVPVEITLGDENAEITDLELNNLETARHITSGGAKKTFKTLSELSFNNMGFDTPDQKAALEELKELCRLKIPEAINVYAKVDKIIKLNNLYKEIRPKISEIATQIRNATTEEEKTQIRESKEAKENTRRYAELRQESQRLINDLKSALDGLRTMSLTKEAAGIEAIYDSGNNSFNEAVKCTISFTDVNGETKNTNLHIRLDFIDDYKYRNCSEDTPYSQVITRIINEFKSEIDKLPQQVKDDLYNEIADIHLLRKDSNGVKGLYNTQSSTIKLLVMAGNPNAYYTSIQPYDIKSAVDSLVHEIGHAIDEKDSGYASEAFQDKFNEYTALLVKKGIIPEDYTNEEHYRSAYYSLTSVDEFFAEVIYANQNGSKSDFTGSNKALESQDPQVQAKLRELYQLGNEIITERRNHTREERIGLKTENVSKIIYKNKDVYEAFTNIAYTLEGDFYNKYGQNPENLLSVYYETKENPNNTSEGAELLRRFEAEYPDDWQKLASLFDDYLKNNSLL